MATNIISCSIPMELAKFLQDNNSISPSKVLQQRLYEIRENEEQLKLRLKVYEDKIYRISARLNKLLYYLQDNKIEIPQDVLE
jgi:hypothetical protein